MDCSVIYEHHERHEHKGVKKISSHFVLLFPIFQLSFLSDKLNYIFYKCTHVINFLILFHMFFYEVEKISYT